MKAHSKCSIVACFLPPWDGGGGGILRCESGAKSAVPQSISRDCRGPWAMDANQENLPPNPSSTLPLELRFQWTALFPWGHFSPGKVQRICPVRVDSHLPTACPHSPCSDRSLLWGVAAACLITLIAVGHRSRIRGQCSEGGQRAWGQEVRGQRQRSKVWCQRSRGHGGLCWGQRWRKQQGFEIKFQHAIYPRDEDYCKIMQKPLSSLWRQNIPAASAARPQACLLGPRLSAMRILPGLLSAAFPFYRWTYWGIEKGLTHGNSPGKTETRIGVA